MNKLQKIACAMVMLLLSVTVQAQEATAGADNADLMRSNGKIYVVIAVVLAILLGLFFYVFSLDRKITRMEKKGING